MHRIVTYTYDADGNRLTVQYPSGTAFNYTYTNRNQAASIKPGLSGGTAVVSYVYDPSGNITSRALDNGTSTAYTVDVVNRDTAVVHNLLPTGTTKRFDYAYNNVNDMTVVQRDSAGGDGFTYDLTQQITGFQRDGTSVNLGTGTVTGGTPNNMLFDGCGNRTSLNDGGIYVTNNMNQPTTFNGLNLTYWPNGNLKTYNSWTYTYDAQNRLTQAVKGTTSATFKYDGKNRQVARSISINNNNVKTFSVWDDWELIEEYTTGNVLVQKYLQGYHGLVKTFVGTAVYYYQDELGSTSHIADPTGALIESYQYDLYGKPRVYNASGVYQPGATPVAKDLFTGQRWVVELGLYDDRNRYMSPDLGRFLQPDPIGFKGDASNLYRYCGNDWANKTDPMGLWPGDVAGTIDYVPQALRHPENRLDTMRSLKTADPVATVRFRNPQQDMAGFTMGGSHQGHDTLTQYIAQGWHNDITASVFGGKGEHTKPGPYGIPLDRDDVAGVALPLKDLKGYSVEVVNRDNHFSARAPAADVGPHYVDDRRYVMHFDRPKAEKYNKNWSGIDLLPQTAKDLGIRYTLPVPGEGYKTVGTPHVDWRLLYPGESQ